MALGTSDTSRRNGFAPRIIGGTSPPPPPLPSFVFSRVPPATALSFSFCLSEGKARDIYPSACAPVCLWHGELIRALPDLLPTLLVLSLHGDYDSLPWNLQARDDGLVTVDMGPPELNGPKVPSTLPTNTDGVVLKEPIQVRSSSMCVLRYFVVFSL